MFSRYPAASSIISQASEIANEEHAGSSTQVAVVNTLLFMMMPQRIRFIKVNLKHVDFFL